MNDLRYPIGQFERRPVTDARERERLTGSIRELPRDLRQTLAELSETHLHMSYREGGWTVQQLVHHLADSHMNGYIRSKLAITETSPVIKPYSQDAWATTHENLNTAVEVSLKLLENLHERWANLFAGLTDADYQRNFIHPEIGPWALHEVLALYEWHGRHHLAHIQAVGKL